MKKISSWKRRIENFILFESLNKLKRLQMRWEFIVNIYWILYNKNKCSFIKLFLLVIISIGWIRSPSWKPIKTFQNTKIICKALRRCETTYFLDFMWSLVCNLHLQYIMIICTLQYLQILSKCTLILAGNSSFLLSGTRLVSWNNDLFFFYILWDYSFN